MLTVLHTLDGLVLQPISTDAEISELSLKYWSLVESVVMLQTILDLPIADN